MARDKSKRKKGKSRREKKKNKRKFQSEGLKKRLKKGQERSKGRQKNVFKDGQEIPTWRPKDGAHIIDVIPYYAGKQDPIVEEGEPTYAFEYWVHTQIGPNNSWFMCPTEMKNEPCPICEHRQKLREEGADEDTWKALFPKRRNLYNIVCYDRGEEEKGVRVWDVSFHYFEKPVMALSKKPGRGGKADRQIDFADPYKGKSINFTVEPAKSKNDYPDFIGHQFDDRDYEIEDDILDDAFVLDELVYFPDYDELSQAYWGEDRGRKSSKSKRGKRGKTKELHLDDLIEKVEDMDDMDDLEDFIEEHDLDVKVKRKDDEEDVQEKIVEALRDKLGDSSDPDDDDGDDDDVPTKKEINKMDYGDLEDLIDKNNLDIDIDDFEEDDDDDLDELREEVIDELDL